MVCAGDPCLIADVHCLVRGMFTWSAAWDPLAHLPILPMVFWDWDWEPARFGHRGQVNRKHHVTRNRTMDNDQVLSFGPAIKTRASRRVMKDNSSSRAHFPPPIRLASPKHLSLRVHHAFHRPTPSQWRKFFSKVSPHSTPFHAPIVSTLTSIYRRRPFS